MTVIVRPLTSAPLNIFTAFFAPPSVSITTSACAVCFVVFLSTQDQSVRWVDLWGWAGLLKIGPSTCKIGTVITR